MRSHLVSSVLYMQNKWHLTLGIFQNCTKEYRIQVFFFFCFFFFYTWYDSTGATVPEHEDQRGERAPPHLQARFLRKGPNSGTNRGDGLRFAAERRRGSTSAPSLSRIQTFLETGCESSCVCAAGPALKPAVHRERARA